MRVDEVFKQTASQGTPLAARVTVPPLPPSRI